MFAIARAQSGEKALPFGFTLVEVRPMTALRSKTVSLALAAALSVGIASAANAANLVLNGSFESFTLDSSSRALPNNWTIGGIDTQNFPPVSILYNSATGYPTGAFGEAVPPNNAPTNSPDAVGLRAAYFVSDLANNQSLSQNVFLNPGTYQIGFSAYAPRNGFNNAGDATFEGIVASISLANYSVSGGVAATWRTFSGSTTIATAGNYDVRFVFNTNLVPSKDVVIDQVYIIEGNPPVGEIPEPSTYALMLAGLAALGFVARRRLS
jgi:hypothetical protein